MQACVRWEVLKPIVTWQVISFQRGIMTSVVGSGVIEHGLESYMVRLMGEAEFIWTGIRH